jgi:cathepsin A (carboxypeptidase C)
MMTMTIFNQLCLVCLLLLPYLSSVSSAPLQDLVESLPDYGAPPTTMFSGYLDATPGCDTSVNGRYCYIHYWLALAKHDAMNQPVVLWLNGGPGSSAILGFTQELGPLLINATGGLHENPYSWTNIANVLIIEAPIGVGYSYCEAQAKGGVCKNTDKFTASASRTALQDFFANKFPELVQNNFFITGESYAGVYIPTLAKEILDHAPEINLKGLAVGDPCTDNTAQRNSMDSLWYGYKYGLIDSDIFDMLWNKCEARVPNLMTVGGKHLAALKLNQQLEIERRQLSSSTIHVKASSSSTTTKKEHHHDFNTHKYHTRLTKNYFNGGERFTDTPECRLAFRKFLMSTSSGLSQGWQDLYIDDYSLFAPVTSQQDEDMNKYMTRVDVREALHVTQAPIDVWPYPDSGFDYTKEYDACNWDEIPEGALSMIDFYKEIAPRLKAVWVYNGDTDPCVSYEGTRTAIKRVGFEELDGGSYRPWFYNHTASSIELLQEKAPLFGPDLLTVGVGAQFGGEVVNYEHGLSFVTVHGSGHMVPQFRPIAALHMLDRLLKFEDLSPPLPKNATLTDLDDHAFEAVMDAWTETARDAPYVTSVQY